MCGLNGILTGDPALTAPALQSLIVGMNQAIAHRGPDGRGTYVDRGIALGHLRLAILDLSAAGRQPMFSADGNLVLIFNGEIYNYLELIPELRARGHAMRTHTDSEVVLHAYAAWGDDCVRRFNGMWAFAIWDKQRRRLFASRDRFGVKPLVYLQRGESLYFSSETAGIRAAVAVHEANPGKLHDYLAYGYRTNDGETFFSGIRELRPGHHLIVDERGLELQRYWALPRHSVATSPVERVAIFRELLGDAVRLRLRSDVPVALLQSGGLDSSAICALVNDQIAGGTAGFEYVTAFTAVHPGHAFDEAASVRELMRSCLHVRSLQMEPRADDLASMLPEFARAMQEPTASPTSYAHWCLMREVHARGLKVIINGQGADEALAGYGIYNCGYRLLDLLLSRPLRVPAEVAAMRQRLGSGYGSLLAQVAKAVLGRHAASAWRARMVEGGSTVLSPAFRRANAAHLPEVSMQLAPRNLDHHLRSQLLDFGFNQILHYEDQSSMSQSIEVRSPFVDYRLMELAFSLPDDDKFAGGVTKRVLRDAFRDRLPASIVDNHRKIGFATPFDRWSAAPSFRDFVRTLTRSPDFRNRQLWDAARLAERLNDPSSVARGFPVWRFVVAALWLRQNGITNA